MKFNFTQCVIICQIVFALTLGAPVEKFKPWQRPCAGSSPSVHVLDIQIPKPTPDEIIPNLVKKSSLFLVKVENATSELKKRFIADNSIINMLERQPKIESFPTDCVISQIQDVNKENYLKISKIYIFIEHFKKFDVNIDFLEVSSSILVSLNDILCEFSLLVDISGYQPIRSLDRTIINQNYQAFAASEFYNWAYVLLRDVKIFGRSVLNVVKNGQFTG